MTQSNAPCAVLVISNLEYGGAQRQIVELMNAMDPSRFDLHLCSLSRYVPLADGLTDRGRLHVLEKRGKFDVGLVFRLSQLLKSLKADIVHGYLFDAVIASRIAGRLAGTPIVISSERNADYTLKRRHLLAYRLTKPCVDLIIANSQAGADFNRRTLGHPASMYRVIHNGVDVQRFAPRDAQALRRELGLDNDTPVAGMFASFKAQKNHELFFRAIAKVVQLMPSARFLLVGDELHGGMHGSDDYKSHMLRLMGDLAITEHCLLLGNRDDVADLYNVCDLTVLSSLFEGTPNVLLESMASGVPVVATEVADNARIAPDGKVGYIVPLGNETVMADRITQVLSNAELRMRLGRQARDWAVSEFSTSALANKTADAYELALAAKRGRTVATTTSQQPRTSTIGEPIGQ